MKHLRGKYWAVLVVGLLLMVLTLGCTQQAGAPKSEISTEEMMEKIITTYSDISSYQMEMDMIQEMSMQTPEEESIKLKSHIQGTGAVDMEERLLYMTMETTMELLEGHEDMKGELEQQGSMAMEMYFVGNAMYMYMDMMDAWMKQELPEAMMDLMWNQQDQMAQQVDMLKGSDIRFVKEEKFDGYPCYVISVDVDEEFLRRQMDEQIGQLIQAMGAEMATQIPAMEFKSYEVIYWIDQDNFFIRKGDIQMEVEMTMVVEEDGEDHTVHTGMAMGAVIRYFGLNEPVTIVLPESAKAAPSTGMIGF